MIAVIQVGEYGDVKEVPKNFTRCGSYQPAEKLTTDNAFFTKSANFLFVFLLMLSALACINL